jgi:hypothetical protein
MDRAHALPSADTPPDTANAEWARREQTFPAFATTCAAFAGGNLSWAQHSPDTDSWACAANEHAAWSKYNQPSRKDTAPETQDSVCMEWCACQHGVNVGNMVGLQAAETDGAQRPRHAALQSCFRDMLQATGQLGLPYISQNDAETHASKPPACILVRTVSGGARHGAGKQARPRGGGNGGALRRSDCDTRELRLVVRP